MHELSVASNIIETVQRAVPEGEQCSVRSVNIRLGTQAGVVSDSLLFCFNVLKDDTPFRNASLRIENVPFSIFCVSCNKTLLSVSGLLICPSCGGTDTTIVSGMELQIVDVELDS
jgi:hydrogenase nickel incorporation protein HypA/HybF